MSNYKQIDIFGNATPLEELLEQNKHLKYGGRIPKKSLFRSVNGYRQGLYCKNCKYFCEYQANRKYFKCKQLGVTSSNATDIRKNDIACNLYED